MISVGRPIPPPVLPAALHRLRLHGFQSLIVARLCAGKLAVGNGTETFDPRGNVTLCNGAVPIFGAPDYRPRDFTWVAPPKADIKRPRWRIPQLSTASPLLPGDKPDIPKVTKDHLVHRLGQKEIGSFNKFGTKVLAGYELQDGKCVKLWDPVPVGQVINNYVPDAGPTASVALTAAFATTVAIFAKPIASLLQKLAKPLTKKVVKKVNQKLGRKVKPESLQQRRVVQRHRNQAIRDLRRALGK